jgi:hypothetical protein
MASHIEEAKSGRASCRTCKKTIAKGELRLGVEVASQFSDSTVQWHHLLCAAQKLPAELKEGMAAYEGDIPDKAALEAAMNETIKKGAGKPGGYPFIDHAPTGRAKCMQCSEAIEKGALRVAVEREIDTGTMVTRGAGYLHPACVAANLEEVGGSVDELAEQVAKNSRIAAEDLAAALESIRGAAAEA